MIKKTAAVLLAGLCSVSFVQAAEAPRYEKQESALFRDIYEQNVHSEVTNALDLGRWTRKIFKKPVRSQNINVFDEVPDSTFWTNRHARKRLSAAELSRGNAENDGMDLSSQLTVYKGKTEGLHPGYFVKDGRGEAYLLKFDSAEYFELATAAENITCRFYHALGYNVPQYTVEFIDQDKLKAGEGARFWNKDGFFRELTQDNLDEQLLFLPQTVDGKYRASASKILAGENFGYTSFLGRRNNDPADPVNHRDRREIRALVVFAAWLNNNDIRESNTLDMLVQENNQPVLKHYLLDFNGALGSAHKGAKPPVFGYEYMFDSGETTKALLALGVWEKPWQRRWRENGEKPHSSSAVGYFDNIGLNAGKYKAQLPYEAFKRLTRADGFWAAKQIMAFTDDDIRAIVAAGKLTEKKDAEYIAATLIERRNIIAQYWFSKAAPLDNFEVKNGKLVFEDLAVKYGFASERPYSAVLVNVKGKIVRDLGSVSTAVSLDSSWFDGGSAVLQLRAAADAPYVRVTLNADGVSAVQHQD